MRRNCVCVCDASLGILRSNNFQTFRAGLKAIFGQNAGVSFTHQASGFLGSFKVFSGVAVAF